MIFFFVTSEHDYTVRYYLDYCKPPLSDLIRVVHYSRLSRMVSLPVGAYLFTDLERLNPVESELAALSWRGLARVAPTGSVLNHPTRSMRRYELLRHLYERGINSFDVYRATEGRRPKRFPVFVRDENRHGGVCSELLRNESELERALERLGAEGKAREDKIIVEYCDSARDGWFRKYAAYRVGDQVIPAHMFCSREWEVHWKNSSSPAPDIVAEELSYLRDNPHAEDVRRVFEAARIEYGRVDYSVVDGKIQVWEINTNPTMVSRASSPDNQREANKRFCGMLERALLSLPGAADTTSSRVRFGATIPPRERLKRLLRPAFKTLPQAWQDWARGKKP